MTEQEWNRQRYEDAKLAYAALMKYYPLATENIDGEEWRPIEGYDDYQVSNYGRVKSCKRNKEIILRPAIVQKGYLVVVLCKCGKMKTFRVHRLAAEAFILNENGKPEINHIDGHRLNNFIGNLEWCTRAENQQHAFNTNLQVVKSGEDCYNSKLTNEQVVYIRNNPDGLTGVALAERFGVDTKVISLIQRGLKYKNAGGYIRETRRRSPRIPDNIQKQIRDEYVYGSSTHGAPALAKKFGIAERTILRIVNGK